MEGSASGNTVSQFDDLTLRECNLTCIAFNSIP